MNTRNRLLTVGLLVLSCLMTACFPVFVAPLSTGTDVPDPGLAGGKWVAACIDEDKPDCTIEFKTGEGNVVNRATYTDPKGNKSELRVQVVVLVGRTFLQVEPETRLEALDQDVASMHYAQVYSIWAFWLDGDELRISMMSDAAFRKSADSAQLQYFRGGPIDFDTSSAVVGWDTESLREFLAAHADELFTEEIGVWKRAR